MYSARVVLVTAVLTLCFGLLAAPAGAATLDRQATFNSIVQNSSMSCSEAKQSVQRAWGYTVNTGQCYTVPGSSSMGIFTSSYTYTASKKRDCDWAACGSWRTTVSRYR